MTKLEVSIPNGSNDAGKLRAALMQVPDTHGSHVSNYAFFINVGEEGVPGVRKLLGALNIPGLTINDVTQSEQTESEAAPQ